MNILAVIPYVPNKIRVRPYNFMRFLAARGNKVTLLTLTSDGEQADIEALRAEGIEVHAFALPRTQIIRNILTALPSSDPIQSFYCWSPQLSRKLEELVMLNSQQAPYDVIHIEHMRGARFGQQLAKKGQRRIPVIWDSVDSISYLFQQSMQLSRKQSSKWITKFELPRSRKYEGYLPALFDRVLITSRVDCQSFSELVPPDFPQSRFEVLPNGVDLEYFQPGDDLEREPNTLVVSGKMSYHANVSMVSYLVDQIMPIIWSKKPDVKLLVVGKDPPGEIRALSADPRIIVTGQVPDIRPYLKKAKVAVAPLTYGAGIQNKILEAMACATPVVVTPRVTTSLSVEPDRELLVGESAEQFANSVISLLDDEDLRKSIGLSGRRYVEQFHDWNRITERLEDIYREENQKKAGTYS